jgi:DNA repair protein RecN (Recombination protein N)
MLKDLYIKNFALIDELSFSPSDSLSTITGETGAGKSILLGALGLILGNRADYSNFFNKENKCIVEGKFQITTLGLKDLFTENDLDYDDETILRREIHPSGKSRAFVNDSPVSLNTLKLLGNRLVDIHSQHQSLDISSSSFQLWVMDQMAGNNDLLGKYSSEYGKYKKILDHLSLINDKKNEEAKELDYNQFLFDELYNLQLIEGEESEIEQQLKQLENAEEINVQCQSAAEAISGEQNSLIDQLNLVLSNLKSLRSVHSGIDDVCNGINEQKLELEAQANELQLLASSSEPDPQKLEQVNERFNSINSLLRKHQVDSTEELLQIQNKLNDKLNSITDFEDQIARLEMEISNSEILLSEMAEKLRTNRLSHQESFSEAVVNELADLGMESARLEIKFSPIEDFGPSGKDQIEYLFSANLNTPLNSIHKGASGGEISRFVFTIKKLLADKVSLPTIIFDEIDTGVSGEIAYKMGEKMKEMSKQIQLVTITHLPQVASQGTKHFYVFKEKDSTGANTMIKELDSEERINAVARMLSGEKTYDSALQNARELIGKNQ